MFRLVVLTGASGSGKTTLANRIRMRCGTAVDVLLFDSIGVPPVENMIASFGSGEAWQRAKTIDWMRRIAATKHGDAPILFEGQMRISFIEEAIALSNIESAKIILIDCDDETRKRRLTVERAQNDLANSTMMTWARYLRDEAQRGGYEVLDTSQLNVEMCVERVCRHISAG